ncbi:MAG: Brp/Blh family beta-carotene 15,15'-dioxygenase [Gracilimonas sp.]|uniref:Brp/Blh family beta-carotene 15,15'-dioxygenase n=1 Tax=Gracilimonas sp. TaxID=1974203 RepID=UPI001B190053|nr:Brp/Blh family beta-carotene 15,15'-dioxygenase [Gracilimonas sp.]MBO6586111.1 Brp/Blh family beta-carotene 15,15'-dioxygenase [Gracilimonas sp.]MBO6614768.1 Brp/Blh family beta-carotene 15,15'-dioxygenase [Gracilimonas sp.]
MGKTYNQETIHQVTLGFAALITDLLFPEFTEAIRFWVLGIVIILVGMPHGSLDHIIAYHSFPEKNKTEKRIWFYGYYTALMAAYAMLWIWFPLFSFLIFLLITLYHFGQADAERFQLPSLPKNILLYSRGLTIVGLILYGSDPVYISEVVEVITGFSSLSLISGYVEIPVLTLTFASIYPIGYLFVLSFLQRNELPAIYLLDALIVPALFAIADPIFAFSVYFGGWHSYNHIRTMLNYLNNRDLGVSMNWFYRKTLFLSLISYAALAALYFIMQAFGDEDLLVGLLFILISVLTLPHIFIVETMYRKFR